MTLRRTSGIVSAVAKMADEDEETAALFVQLSLFNTMADLIEQADQALEVDTNEIIAKGAQVARERLLANSPSMSEEEIVEAALAVQVLDAYVVQKGLFGYALDVFNRLHDRDASGRFISMNVQQKPGEQRTAQQTAGQKQAKKFVDRLKRAKMVDDDTELNVHYREMKQGGSFNRKNKETLRLKAKAGTLEEDLAQHATDNPKHTLMAVSLARRNIPGLGDGATGAKRRAALDVMNAFAGPTHEAGTTQLARSLPLDTSQEDWNARGAKWNRPGTPNDRQVYRRMSMTGQALAHATIPGTSANMVGNLARLVGDLGPEAEKVLGPGLRRTAYRYRGTERRPDQAILNQNREASANGAIVLGRSRTKDPMQREQLQQLTNQMVTDLDNPKTQVDGAGGSAGYWLKEAKEHGLQPDQFWLRTHGDTAAITMVQQGRLPSLRNAELSLKSGELPPSQGVIIDADGDITTEAQGFNGDHYLPFDLKNLKDLQGGQYVRTRASGGLTTEDLYTGLLTGARQVQVVSNSGVFTLEFDPDVRGGRRYTDKALRMIGRYGRLLETIESGQIMEQDISPKEKADLYRQAVELSRDKDPDEIRGFHNDLIQAARAEQERPDEEEFAQAAANEVDAEYRRDKYVPTGGERGKAIDAKLDAMMGDYHDKRVRTQVLDGHGYAFAMTALQSEFPFFIRRADYESLPDFLEARGQRPQGGGRGAREIGYVERGETNPKRAAGAPRTMPSATAQPAATPTPTPTSTPGERPESVGDEATLRVTAQQRQAQLTGGAQAMSLADAVKRDGPVGKAVEARVVRFGGPLGWWSRRKGAAIEPDTSAMTNDQVYNSMGPTKFLQHRISTVAEDDPAKFTDWLMNQATDKERSWVKEGLTKLHAWVERLDDTDQDEVLDGQDFTAWDQVVQDVKNVIDAGKPFADPATDWLTARAPETSLAKPQPIKEIVNLGTNPDAYDDYLAKSKDADFKAAVTFFETNPNQKPSEIARSVNSKVDDVEAASTKIEKARAERALAANQQAWAFFVARGVAQNLSGLLAEGQAPAGGASPLVKREPEDPLQHALFLIDQLDQP